MDLTKYPAHFHIGVNPNVVEDAQQGKFELKEGLAVRIAANKDPQIRVDKKDSLHTLFIAPYDWNNYWQAGKNKDRQDEKYKKLKKDLEEKMIKMIEKVIPEISNDSATFLIDFLCPSSISCKFTLYIFTSCPVDLFFAR